MKGYLRRGYSLAVMLGIDPVKTIRAARGLPQYLRDLREFKKQTRSAARQFDFGKLYPCLDDRLSESGTATGHYFHQDLLVARRIFENNPRLHLDVGSRIDGLVAHVAAFRPIEVVDIRPLPGGIRNIKFMQADFMATLPEALVEYCDSISCLHAIEHFGLGRYGDPVNHDGHLLGLRNLHKALVNGGKLYLSTPIGPQRIEFNAHRVFDVTYLLECLAGNFTVDRFSFVDDSGNLHEDVALADSSVKANYGCTYGCGIFELTKL